MFKKNMALLLAGTMMLSLGAGFGVSAEEAAADEIVLTCWTWDKNVDLAIETARLYSELTGKNIRVEAEQMSQQDIAQKLIAINESGDYDMLPDISMAEDAQFAKYVNDTPELFFDVGEYVKDWDQLGVAKTSLTTVGGVSYGIPLDNSTAVCMYRTDKLAEAGYTIDDLTGITWDEFLEIAKDFKEKTGMYLMSSEASTFVKVLFTGTMQLFNEDGTPNVGGNEDAYAIAETIKKIYDSGAVYFPNDWNDFIASFTGGEVAAGTMQGSWIANNVNTAPDQAGLWELAPTPSVNENSKPTNSGGSSWFVLSKGENAAVAAEMLAYMYTDDGMMELADYMTKDIGLIMTYKPLIESGFYNEIDDGFYRKGFWGDLAKAGDASPVFTASPVFSPTMNELTAACQAIFLEGADIASTIDAVQETIEFQMY